MNCNSYGIEALVGHGVLPCYEREHNSCLSGAAAPGRCGNTGNMRDNCVQHRARQNPGKASRQLAFTRACRARTYFPSLHGAPHLTGPSVGTGTVVSSASSARAKASSSPACASNAVDSPSGACSARCRRCAALSRNFALRFDCGKGTLPPQKIEICLKRVGETFVPFHFELTITF